MKRPPTWALGVVAYIALKWTLLFFFRGRLLQSDHPWILVIPTLLVGGLFLLRRRQKATQTPITATEDP